MMGGKRFAMDQPPTFTSIKTLGDIRIAREVLMEYVIHYCYAQNRLLMCGQINEDDFYTLHHEMGHLYYYLAYRNQPQLFRVSV